MKQILHYFLLAAFFLFSGSLSGQSARVVTGTVTETVGGSRQPVAGVNVTVVNTQNRTLSGTITDANGQYNLRIPAGESNLTLMYSFIGMKSVTRSYTGQTLQDMVLESDDMQIETIQVVGRQVNSLGVSERGMVSATQKVNLSEIAETSAVTSIEEMLQGQLAGVDIIAGGDPGTRSSIVIRGIGTLNSSSEPLIVIDGVPYSTSLDDFDFNTANEEDLGALLNISPSDIESVEVLKDASATAIWGTEGANGVLMITTKRGRKGETQFAFTTKYTTKIEPSTIPMLSGPEYKALMQDAIWNSARYVGVSNASSYLRLLFDTPEIGYQPDWKYFPEYSQNTDWLDLVTQTANVFEGNFAVSGGGDKADYRVSMSVTNEGGTTIGTNFLRINTTANVNYRFSDRLTFGADFAYSDANRDANFLTDVRTEAFSKMPNKSPYIIDRNTGAWTDDYFTYHSLDWEGNFAYNQKKSTGSVYNPVAMVHEATNNTVQRERRIKINMDYKIIPGLTWRAWASINSKTVKTNKFLPQSVTGVAWISNYANLSNEAYSENLAIQTQNQLTFFKNWENDHILVANALFMTKQSTSSSYTSYTAGMASSDVTDPIVGNTVREMGSGESESRSLRGTLHLNYTFKDRYVFNATVSMEGNSAMGRNERWGTFPSVGAAWNIDREAFLESAEWLDFAKLRLGIGMSGRAPDGNSIYMGSLAASDNYMTMPAIYPSSIQLDRLKWENSTEYNVGMDLAFIKNRLKFTFDYYQRYSSDLLQKDVSVPSSTGFAKIAYWNSGKAENRGFEFRTDIIFLQKKDWTVSGYMNMARNRNKITELPSNMSVESGIADGDANMTNGQYAFRVEEGTPIGSFYGYRYRGVYQDKNATYARDAGGKIMNDMNGNPIIMRNGTYTAHPGDAVYEDVNNDGVINKYDIVYLGNSQPTLTGGAGVTVRYKQVSVSAFFHGRFGQSIVNATRMNNESMYGRKNQSTAVLRRWQKTGDQTDIPRALYNEGLNFLGSDRFVEDASYFRLKSVTVNYRFPAKLCKRVGLNNASVFATGYNLFTWTNYKGQDPEVQTPSKPTEVAKDEATTPVSKRFAFGLNITF